MFFSFSVRLIPMIVWTQKAALRKNQLWPKRKNLHYLKNKNPKLRSITSLKFNPLQVPVIIQVIFFQKLLFLHQLTHNITKDCSLIYHFSSRKLQAQNLLCTQIVFLLLFWYSKQFMYTCSEFGIFMYWACNSMHNLSSYCGLVDAKIRASDKDLPVCQ